MILLFSLRSLLRLDILVWVVGLPVLLGAAVLLGYQVFQSRELKRELSQLAKMKVYSVEYDLVLKAMKLAIFRFDLAERTFTVETDYRDASDNNVFPPGTKIGDLYQYMAPEYRTNMKQGMQDLLNGRSEVFHEQIQIKMPHTDHTYWTEVYATIDKRDLQGRPVSVVGTLMRIDQQKEIEKVLMDAVYHAEESDRLKSAFLANISHEIRTPLNAIVGFSDVLPMAESEEERQELIGLIKQNNTLLLQLFDDIVSMSKLEARSGESVKKTEFVLKELLEELSDKYKDQADAKGLSIVIAEPESLPRLTTDRSRLREILNQYMNNALKFTFQGQVTMGCDAVDGRWRIWVRDTGKGIPAENCNEHLFERFVKVDDFVPGTGLGLSICRSMAMTLGGSVGVASTVGEGSLFWVDLDKN